MSWWCEREGGGVDGMAFVGALCSSYNTNLNEKQGSAAGSGYVCIDENIYSDSGLLITIYITLWR